MRRPSSSSADCGAWPLRRARATSQSAWNRRQQRTRAPQRTRTRAPYAHSCASTCSLVHSASVNIRPVTTELSTVGARTGGRCAQGTGWLQTPPSPWARRATEPTRTYFSRGATGCRSGTRCRPSPPPRRRTRGHPCRVTSRAPAAVPRGRLSRADHHSTVEPRAGRRGWLEVKRENMKRTVKALPRGVPGANSAGSTLRAGTQRRAVSSQFVSANSRAPGRVHAHKKVGAKAHPHWWFS